MERKATSLTITLLLFLSLLVFLTPVAAYDYDGAASILYSSEWAQPTEDINQVNLRFPAYL